MAFSDKSRSVLADGSLDSMKDTLLSSQLKARRRFLKAFSALAVVPATLGTIASFGNGGVEQIINIAVTVSLLLLIIAVWVLLKLKKEAIATWILQLVLVGGVSLLVLTSYATVFIIGLVAYPLIAMFGLIMINPAVSYFTIALGIVVEVVSWQFRGFTVGRSDGGAPGLLGIDDLGILSTLQFVCIWIAHYLRSTLIKTNTLVQMQAEQVKTALEELQAKRAASQEISQKLFSFTTQLFATASQQTNGSREQASALTQLISSQSELSATSEHIAGKAEGLKGIASEIHLSTGQVRKSATKAVDFGEEGVRAVQETMALNKRLDEHYSHLHNLLIELQQQREQMAGIIVSIGEIGATTHLLALNAAIEASSAGVNGLRFSVIAQEIKSLADRTLQASRSVKQILTSVEESIGEAASSSDSGHANTRLAVDVALRSGDAINKLAVALRQNLEEIERIETGAQTMTIQADEISSATNQQYHTLEEVTENFKTLGNTANQIAGGSSQIAEGARHLEELSQQLVTLM